MPEKTITPPENPSGVVLPGPEGMRFLQASRIERLSAGAPSLRKRAAAPPDDPAADPAPDANPDENMPVYRVAVSSEYEVERDFFGIRWREVLMHSPEAVKLDRFTSGRAAVLEEHRGVQIGVIDDAELSSDHVMRADIRFSRNPRGQEARQDVDDQVRTNISVGYIPLSWELAEHDEERGDLYRITRWEPVELSLVGIPADPTVGVGRSMTDGSPHRGTASGGIAPPALNRDGRVAAQEERSMKPEITTPPAGEVTPAARAAAATAAPPNDRQDILEIVRMCEANGMGSRAAEYIERGLDANTVARELLSARATKATAQPGAESLTEMGMAERDAKRYSVARAILGAAEMRNGKPLDGVEGEVHRHLEKLVPGGARNGGVLMPLNRGLSTRGLDSKTATKGAELVAQQAGDLIELLRNRTALLRLGARFLPGLNAPIGFPKQSGATTAYWGTENPASAVTASDVAFAIALLTPKPLQATTSYSRQLLASTSQAVDQLVEDDLAQVNSIAVDFAGIHGLGAAGEPTGIYSALNVSATAVGGAMTYAKALAMQGQVAAANADLGSLGWLMHPTMATNLKGVPMFSNTATPVWDGTYLEGVVGGYRAVATNQVSKTMTGSARTGGTEIGSIFGNFGDLYVGQWGPGMELVVDPYTLADKGMIKVTSFLLADVLARHGESFSKSTGATG